MIGNSGLGPAPTFSNWMRQPTPGGTVSAASEQTSTRVADVPVRPDTMQQAASAPSQKRQTHHAAEKYAKRARVEDAAGLRRTAQVATPRAPRALTSKPQLAGRNIVATRTKRGPRGRSDSDGSPVFSEFCHESALAGIASRRRAATWHPTLQGPSLRRIISDFLAQVREGRLATMFWEEGRMKRLGLRGRRYSGTRGQARLASKFSTSLRHRA